MGIIPLLRLDVFWEFLGGGFLSEKMRETKEMKLS